MSTFILILKKAGGGISTMSSVDSEQCTSSSSVGQSSEKCVNGFEDLPKPLERLPNSSFVTKRTVHASLDDSAVFLERDNFFPVRHKRFSVTRVPERDQLVHADCPSSLSFIDRLSRKANKPLKVLIKPETAICPTLVAESNGILPQGTTEPVDAFKTINLQEADFCTANVNFSSIKDSIPLQSFASSTASVTTVFSNSSRSSRIDDLNSLTWSGSTASKIGLLNSISETSGSCSYSTAVPSTADVFLRQTSNSPYSTVRSDRTSTSSVNFQDDYVLSSKKALGAGLGRVCSSAALASTSSRIDDYGLDSRLYRLPNVFSANMAAKHLNTEQFMVKYGYKAKLTKYQGYMDRAFAMINTGSDAIVIQGLGMMAKVMAKAWTDPKFSHDLAYSLCDYVQQSGLMSHLLKKYTTVDEPLDMLLAVGGALEECLSGPNREILVQSGFLESLVKQLCRFDKEDEALRISLSIMESLLKHNARTCGKVVELGGLDHILKVCKTCTDPRTLRHAALSLSNLAMFGGPENLNQLICRNVPEWLFLLASMQDDITRYYACLAICILVSNQEIEAAVVKSGTLGLVEPFLLTHKPEDFANCDFRHQQGRPTEWLERLVPLLTSKRREARSMGAYHFVMEATIKKNQEKLDMFQKVPHLIDNLKELASSPDELPANFASQALEIIGETVPYKLSEDVPLWKAEDVKFWVTKIGFAEFADSFYNQQVDGDILLLMTEEELEEDIGMRSSLMRHRFMREMKALMIGTDYSCVDESRLDKFLMSISPDFSVYTYRMIEAGIDREMVPKLTNEILLHDCRIKNGIHRMKILEAIEDVQHLEDMEIAVLRKHVDVFISYRRNTGSQLASLLRVLLQLRGYKVFIDVDRLYAGQFDSSLLMNIKAAKHFVLVLSPQALDRCIGDDQCNDWIHKEIKCALENEKNIVPVLAPCFFWPEESSLPDDMRDVTRFNSVQWVHEYQEACVDKIDKFLKGELNIARGQRQNSAVSIMPARASAAKFTVGSPRSVSPTPLSPVLSDSYKQSSDSGLGEHSRCVGAPLVD